MELSKVNVHSYLVMFVVDSCAYCNTEILSEKFALLILNKMEFPRIVLNLEFQDKIKLFSVFETKKWTNKSIITKK